MKTFFNSLLSKTLFILFLSSSIFIGMVFFSANYFFSNGYISMIKEDIASVQANINPMIALNLSYGFDNSIDDIAQTQLKNKKILVLKIDSKLLKKTKFFSNTNKTIKELKKEKNYFSTTDLIDPATSKKIGTITLIYSNKSYKTFMNNFYKYLFIGGIIFILSLFIVGSLLYNTLKNLTSLASSFEKFNPRNPQIIDIDIKSNDEVGIITKSANILLNNLSKYLKSIQKLNETVLEKEAHLKQAQRIANIGSWEYDVVNDKLQLSDEIYRILKTNLKIKINWDDFLSLIIKRDYNNILQSINKAVQNGSTFDLTYTIKTTNGSLIDIRTRGKVRKKQNNSIKIIAVSMDITQENKNKQTIEKLAFYDPLTSLPNRTLLKNRIHKALQNAKREKTKLALMFLDLDHFKLINDTLGHDTGDKLLIYIAGLLKNQLRESDTASRIGGDEFVILVPKVDSLNSIHKIANKCLEALRGQHTIDEHKLYLTTSIGIATYPDNGKDLDTLMTNADTAMYDAKNNGRNNYKFFSKNMTNFISQHLETEQDLRLAIKNKKELEIYYQPKIDTFNNTISGAEALIRWNHPTKGLIFPDEFIHIAESTGLIIEIGNWIIEKCMLDISTWNKNGISGVKIAINLSAKQFQNDNLINHISSMIKKYNIDPKELEFEITETLSMANIDATLTILSELKKIGVSIAIDDFGTGYSSLSYLKKFPINTLKVDKSFVMEMVDDDEDSVIVKTIISMAHSLGFQTVAEGVETKEHVEALKELKCDQLQGYFYSKAIQKNEFVKYIRSNIADN